MEALVKDPVEVIPVGLASIRFVGNVSNTRHDINDKSLNSDSRFNA